MPSKIIFFLFFSLCFSSLVFGQIKELEDKDKYLIKNTETGVYDSEFELSDDATRFSLLGGMNINPKKAFEFLQGEIQLGLNMKYFWGEAFYAYQKSSFGNISENPHNSSANLYAESNNERPSDANASIMSYGAGISYRHHFPEEINFFHLANLFHSAAFYVTYNSLIESYRNLDYKGPGIKAQYGIGKRFLQSTEAGFKFAYWLAKVKRGEFVSDEANSDKTLLLSYITASFDLTFYF